MNVTGKLLQTTAGSLPFKEVQDGKQVGTMTGARMLLRGSGVHGVHHGNHWDYFNGSNFMTYVQANMPVT